MLKNTRDDQNISLITSDGLRMIFTNEVRKVWTNEKKVNSDPSNKKKKNQQISHHDHQSCLQTPPIMGNQKSVLLVQLQHNTLPPHLRTASTMQELQMEVSVFFLSFPFLSLHVALFPHSVFRFA